MGISWDVYVAFVHTKHFDPGLTLLSSVDSVLVLLYALYTMPYTYS